MTVTTQTMDSDDEMRKGRTVDDGDQHSAGFAAESKTTPVVAGICSGNIVLNKFTMQQVATFVGRTLVDGVWSVVFTAVDRLVAQIVVSDVDRDGATCFRFGPDDVLRGRRYSLLANQV